MVQHIKREPDFAMIFIIFLILGFGIVMVFSSSYYFAGIKFNDPNYFFKKQALFSIIGVVTFFIFANINYKIYRRYVGVLLITALILLLALFVPFISLKIKGATRWLNLGFFSFQPSELVKIIMIIYTAHIMVKKQPYLNSFTKSLLLPLIMIALICGLILVQPHYSATIIILLTCITIIYCAGAKISHLIGLAVTGIPVLIGLLYIADYRIDRLKTIFDKSDNFMNEKYQVMHSFLAMVPGGLTGTGLGQSIQKLGYLPEPFTDFIFPIIAEELGFIGGAFLIFLFGALIVRGIIASLRAPDQFGSLLAIGIVTLLAIEVIFNLGVVTNLLPVTGVPLPLISYGGTALVIKLCSLGILVNISKYGSQTKAVKSSSSF